MKPKLLITFGLIVGLPLALLGWIGAGMARDERDASRERFRAVFSERLSDIDSNIAAVMAAKQKEVLDRIEDIGESPAEIRSLAWNVPEARQLFLLDNAGLLLFPLDNEQATEREREFLTRTESIWEGHELLSITRRRRQGEEGRAEQRARYTSLVGRPSEKGPSIAPDGSADDGWHAYFWNQGLQLLVWRRLSNGQIVGAELDRSRLMADVIAALPDTPVATGESSPTRIALTDSQDRTIYEWGEFERGDEEAIATRALAAPLGAWSVEQYVSPEFFATGEGLVFNLVAGLSALGLALIGLATYFYRESSRDLRDASQRVSFVNQVSHELKTPLTNIRLYAELLEKELGDENEEASRELGVIVTESQRLSRLIGNILTFSRKSRETLALHRAEGIVDDALRGTIEHFRPLLAAKDISIEFEGDAGEAVRFDSDAVEQILGNLLANVEKYVPPGGRVTVKSRTEGDMTTVRVEDDGPGIPNDKRDLIFDPFYRVTNSLTEGVAGTGIGLAIARDLARLHGGDLTLEAGGGRGEEQKDGGAVFKLTLRHD